MGKCRIANHRLGQCESVEELCQVVTQELCSLTGYDRIMVYQFDEEWNGAVIAEHCVEGLEPYLGLHYPASDIPAQARAMFLLNGLRVIPDAQYQPVPLFPTAHPGTGQPLDLSRAHLRSVSPIHLEYLRNMGVGASLTISLVVDGKLWGLIACHHRSPRFLSPALREVCELFGQMVSMQLTERLQAAGQEGGGTIERSAASPGRARPAVRLDHPGTAGGRKRSAGVDQRARRDSLARRRGVADRRDPSARIDCGNCSSGLRMRPPIPIFFTDCLPKRFPGAEAYADVASGMLALALSRAPDVYILWFRPEVISTVDWAGDPDKSIEPVGNDGRIHPRRSFARWKKSVRHRSLPWLKGEIEAVDQLQTILQAQLARTAEQLAAAVADLCLVQEDSIGPGLLAASRGIRQSAHGYPLHARHVSRMFRAGNVASR